VSEFSVGASVRVKRLRRVGVISAVLGSGRYSVTVGMIAVTCRSEELEPAEPTAPPQPGRITLPDPPRRLSSRLDLHGLTVAQAITRVDEYLNQAALAKLMEVEILHGYGSGRVREALHAHLATLSMVSAFKIHEVNGGITRVFL